MTRCTDIEDISSRPKTTEPIGFNISPEEHAKLFQFLQYLQTQTFSDKKEFRKEIDRYGRQIKFMPKRVHLSRVFFNSLWPTWLESTFPKTEPLMEYLLPFLTGTNGIATYGLANVSITTETMNSCDEKCTYCPTTADAPKSYFNNEPAVARGYSLGYNVAAQFRRRVKDYAVSGVCRRLFDPEAETWISQLKADVRLLGGTFFKYPLEKRTQFFTEVYYAANTIDDEFKRPMMPLAEEVEAHILRHDGVRIVGLSMETRPEKTETKILSMIQELSEAYVTWAEFGIQTTNDAVHKLTKRGLKHEHSRLTIAMFKAEGGFKILLHSMQCLPLSTPESDVAQFVDDVVENPEWLRNSLWRFALWLGAFAIVHWYTAASLFGLQSLLCCSAFWAFIWWSCEPRRVVRYSIFHLGDHIKKYPCMDLPGSEMHDRKKWPKSKWDPYSEWENGGEILLDVLCQISMLHPPWIRDARTIRDFHPASEKNGFLGYTSTGIRTNMAQLMYDRLKGQNVREIRSREVRNEVVDLSRQTFTLHSYRDFADLPQYSGTEYFGEFCAPDTTGKRRLIGLVRLRLNNHKSKLFGLTAIVREVHVYGEYTPVGKKSTDVAVQHRGFGKKLVKIAECIAFAKGYREIAVISAAGTVNYYGAKCGYKRKGRYSRKDLTWAVFAQNVRDLAPTLLRSGMNKLW